MNEEEAKLYEDAMKSLTVALLRMRAAKPDDRSETARKVQVLITKMEDIVDLWKLRIIDGNGA